MCQTCASIITNDCEKWLSNLIIYLNKAKSFGKLKNINNEDKLRVL